MSNTENEHSLFKEFPPVSTEEWEEVIRKDLRGADYKEKLKWETGEGVEAMPFYRREDLLKRPVRLVYNKDGGGSWEIRESIFRQSVEDANAASKQALEKGARALNFTLKVRSTAGMLGGDLQGTAIQNQEAFGKLLDGIDITNTPIHFDAGLASPVLLAMLHNFTEESKADPGSVSGSFLFDPYAFVAVSGQLPEEKQKIDEISAGMVQFSTAKLPGIRCLGVDARTYHNCGATIVQELGYALATGSEYLARLTAMELKAGDIASNIHFNFSIGSNYFLEIAKFRAARKLWEKVLDAYGLDPDSYPMYIHGKSSEWNKTVYDPYNNMLRTTTEGMSAAIGGCDSITLDPFDKELRRPDEFSSRIARNQQIILQDEAYLDKVTDPAAGSYYIEVLTDKIAEAVWDCFREVEQQGGLMQSIMDGYIPTAVEESRQKRDRSIAKRGRVFVGTNQYPNPDEKLEERETSEQPTVSLTESDIESEIDPDELMSSLKKWLREGSTLGDLMPQFYDLKKHNIRPIRPYRGPQDFEAIRRATEQHEATPKVLTLPLGNKKMRKARSTFTSNFFGCAGYDIEDPIGFDTVDDAISAIEQEQPDIVVLCSSDDEYKELVPALCEKLDEVKTKPILALAGYPQDDIETYKKAGVDDFIHAKSNVLESLQSFQQKLGIS